MLSSFPTNTFRFVLLSVLSESVGGGWARTTHPEWSVHSSFVQDAHWTIHHPHPHSSSDVSTLSECVDAQPTSSIRDGHVLLKASPLRIGFPFLWESIDENEEKCYLTYGWRHLSFSLRRIFTQVSEPLTDVLSSSIDIRRHSPSSSSRSETWKLHLDASLSSRWSLYQRISSVTAGNKLVQQCRTQSRNSRKRNDGWPSWLFYSTQEWEWHFVSIVEKRISIEHRNTALIQRWIYFSLEIHLNVC